jgi:hypothetical protein
LKTISLSCLLTLLAIPQVTVAAPRDDILGQYATAAKTASPAFSGFSAKRGETLHLGKFTGGKPDTPSCTTCHGDSPRSAGRTPAGKAIDPVAVSVSPARYTDPAKVEKWFRRNCTEVLGRECTPLEKGDWLTYVISQ